MSKWVVMFAGYTIEGLKMSSLININGNEIKEKNGDFYINGKKVVNNCVDSSNSKASIFFAGLSAGFMLAVVIAEFI